MDKNHYNGSINSYQINHIIIMASWYHWILSMYMGINDYKNVMESLCNDYVAMVMWEVYVVVVYGYVVIVLVMLRVVMEIHRNMVYEKRIKDKDIKEKQHVEEKEQLEQKEHIKAKQEEHVKVKEEQVKVKGLVKVMKQVAKKVVKKVVYIKNVVHKMVEKLVLEKVMIHKMTIVILHIILIKFNTLFNCRLQKKK
eukprot:180715_1